EYRQRKWGDTVVRENHQDKWMTTAIPQQVVRESSNCKTSRGDNENTFSSSPCRIGNQLYELHDWRHLGPYALQWKPKRCVRSRSRLRFCLPSHRSRTPVKSTQLIRILSTFYGANVGTKTLFTAISVLRI